MIGSNLTPSSSLSFKGIIPPGVLDFLKNPDTFLVVGHSEPDADCLGSQIALAHVVQSLGGRAVLASAGPFLRPEIKPWESLFLADPDACPRVDRAVVLDCSSPSRAGPWQAKMTGLPVLVIDHHAGTDRCGEVDYIDPEAPSTALLVFRIYEALGLPLTPAVAYSLMLASCTDTGFFRHLGPAQGETLRMCAQFSDLGVSLQDIHALMTGGQLATNLRLLGNLLGRLQLHYEGRLAYTFEEEGERESLQASNRPSDLLYQLIFTIDSVEMAVVLRTENGATIGGLRSRRTIDCAQIASGLGGGGHVRASGFRTEKPLDQVKTFIFAEFERALGG